MVLRTYGLTLAVVTLAACSNGTDETSGPQALAVVQDVVPLGVWEMAEPDTDWFTDEAAERGLDFVHNNGATGAFHYPELFPPGVALFDYDNDGDLDVFVVQGRVLDVDGGESQGASGSAAQIGGQQGRLYRNELVGSAAGGAGLRFTDVTRESGIAQTGYGIGIATGDVDNDGWVDLLITNYEPTQLLRNNGDGTFTDISRQSGISRERRFGVSAAFFDYDRDGWLDLYVGHNVDYQLDNGIECGTIADARDYCPPETYGGTPDRLYHNEGHGRFVDVTDTALGDARFGPALGVASADYNGDGWVDIYVANDGTDNLLWINQQNGTFRNTALLSGVAVSGLGVTEASMGVDAGDFDNDGDEDLFMTHLTREGNNLYVNDGAGMFQDESVQSGLGVGSMAYTGWGTTWFDYDNDGWLDVLTVNGTITARDTSSAQPFPYGQRKTLFRNLRDGRFGDVTDEAGRAFELSESGRGAAFGDIDNDGDMDVLVGNDGGPLRLLINQLNGRHHWLGLRLVDGNGRDALGARVGVHPSGMPTRWRRARADGSYASANDPRILVGLGDTAGSVVVEVLWPSGRHEQWGDIGSDQWTTLQEGEGRATAP